MLQSSVDLAAPDDADHFALHLVTPVPSMTVAAPNFLSASRL
jgi:hypothetical protein